MLTIFTKHPRVLNMRGFQICQGSKYTKALNMPLVLNLPRLWINQGSEYVRLHRVLNMPEYVCVIMPGWICMGMSEYANICVHMPKSAWMAFALYFPIVMPCLLERVLTYFNVCTKLEVFVLRRMMLFSSRHKHWFFYSSCIYIWFLF